MSQEAWLNAKGISSIRSPCLEKTSKMCSNIGIFWHWPKTAKSDHILDVFSGQGGRIELIPFALSQASWDTSLDYPQHIIPKTLKFHFLWLTPLEGPLKIYYDEQNLFPDVLLYVGHQIIYLLIYILLIPKLGLKLTYDKDLYHIYSKVV